MASTSSSSSSLKRKRTARMSVGPREPRVRFVVIDLTIDEVHECAICTTKRKESEMKWCLNDCGRLYCIDCYKLFIHRPNIYINQRRYHGCSCEIAYRYELLDPDYEEESLLSCSADDDSSDSE
jgi:hypothetical protein